jgi:hypothetical protein
MAIKYTSQNEYLKKKEAALCEDCLKRAELQLNGATVAQSLPTHSGGVKANLRDTVTGQTVL